MAPATYRIPCNAHSHANDHRTRYRKRAARPAHNAARARQPAPEPQPPSAAGPGPQSQAAPARNQEDQPPQQQAAAARWQRITDLNARLTTSLDDEKRALWLALEEALHVHWLDVAVDHYHRGYAAGRAQAWLDVTLAEQASPHEKLRALSAALSDVVDRLQRPPPDTDS